MHVYDVTFVAHGFNLPGASAEKRGMLARALLLHLKRGARCDRGTRLATCYIATLDEADALAAFDANARLRLLDNAATEAN